jgi:hypothetical protein
MAGPLFDVSNSPRVMKWDGGSCGRWVRIDGRILALAIYQGDLYAGGEFPNAEDQYVSKRWAERTAAGGRRNQRGRKALRSGHWLYGGRLIAGGYFSSPGGVPARGVAA